jgi:hypothetical protein
MSTVRDAARGPRRATEETKPYRASLPALLPRPAEATKQPVWRPTPWPETLCVFLIVAIVGLAIYIVVILGAVSLARLLSAQ